jgi:hypothetical protein
MILHSAIVFLFLLGTANAAAGASQNTTRLTPECVERLQSLIGVQYENSFYQKNTYPITIQPGIKQIGGSSSDGRCTFATLDVDKCPRAFYIGLTFEKNRNTTVISDVLFVSVLEENETFHTFACSLNGKIDKGIVVLGREDEKCQWSHNRKAWRVNQETGKFQAIPPEGIICEAECCGDCR